MLRRYSGQQRRRGTGQMYISMAGRTLMMQKLANRPAKPGSNPLNGGKNLRNPA
jgi:ribosomal protein L24E